MTVVNKILQLKEVKLPALKDLAEADGKHTTHAVATWIISHSLYWKGQGYNKIIKEMQDDKHN